MTVSNVLVPRCKCGRVLAILLVGRTLAIRCSQCKEVKVARETPRLEGKVKP